ncbi:MAG: hypothetical protein KKG10_16375, partial [Proteobacteria bacterium]|nr:hypothetical protein [Pseudomonadota bacterium]
WKWKYLILIGTLVCVIGAAVVSLNMTKIYGISTVVQPGMLKVTEDGKTVYIDSPQNIQALIETGGVNGQVLKNIKFPDTEKPPRSVEFKVTIPKNTNALEVLYETPYVDIGLQIVKNLNNGLLDRYSRLIKLYEDNYNNEIRSKSNEAFKLSEKVAKVKHAMSTAEAENESRVSEISAKISTKRAEISTAEAEKDSTIKQQTNNAATVKAQIDAKKKQIINLQQRISDVKMEIDRVSKNTDLLIEERTRFLASSGKQDNILASVIYTNTIQQNISYLNTLRSTINSTNHQIFQEDVGVETLENKIRDVAIQNDKIEKQTQYRVENLKSDIKDLEAQKESLIKQTKYKVETMQSEIKDFENEKNYISGEIKSIEFKKNNIQNIQIIRPPKSSLSPIKPKTRLNVMLAGVVGLFLTVFLAFFVEYVSKYKNRE